MRHINEEGVACIPGLEPSTLVHFSIEHWVSIRVPDVDCLASLCHITCYTLPYRDTELVCGVLGGKGKERGEERREERGDSVV